MVAEMAKIGLVPGEPFDPAKLGLTSRGPRGVPPEAQTRSWRHSRPRTPRNGWTYSTHLGVYGTDYLSALTTAVASAPTGRRMPYIGFRGGRRRQAL